MCCELLKQLGSQHQKWFVCTAEPDVELPYFLRHCLKAASEAVLVARLLLFMISSSQWPAYPSCSKAL